MSTPGSSRLDSGDPFGIVDGYSPPESYQRTEEEARLSSRLETLWMHAQAGRSAYTRDWFINKAYLSGDQLLYRDVNTQDIVRVFDTGGDDRLWSVNNVIQPAARYLHGKLCRQRTGRTVTPGTMTQDAIAGARVAENFIKYFDRKWLIGALMSRAYKSVVYAGNAVIQLTWDPNGGKCLAYCETCHYVDDESKVGEPCPMCSMAAEQTQQLHAQADQAETEMYGVPYGAAPEPQPVSSLVKAYEGSEKPIVHDVEKVFVDPSATVPEECNYIIVQHTMSVQDLRQMFPEKGKYVRPGIDPRMMDPGSRGYDPMGRTLDQANYEDMVTVLEHHEKPSAQHPTGRVLFVANGIVLADKPGMYDLFKRLPFFFQVWWTIPGRFWAQSFIDHCRPRQKELNELETQMREYTALIAKNKVLAQIGCGLSADELTATTGQILFYNPGSNAPTYMDTPPMPPFLLERRQQYIDSINQHAAVTAAETGQGPGDPTGRALAILQAEGDQQIQGMQETNNAEMTMFYKCLLLLCKRMYSPDRQFAVAGEFGPEVYTFNDMHFDLDCQVELELEDGFANNPQVRQQQVGNYISMGFFMDPMTGRLDEARAAKAARLKIPVNGIESKSADYANAQALLKKIEQGDFQAQPQLWDDAEIFREATLNWLKTKSARWGEPYVNVVMQLYMGLEQKIMQAAMAAAGAGAPQPGGEASAAGSQQSAPGGSPNNLGVGAEQTRDHNKSVASEAASNVQGADASAEAQAKSAANES